MASRGIHRVTAFELIVCDVARPIHSRPPHARGVANAPSSNKGPSSNRHSFQRSGQSLIKLRHEEPFLFPVQMLSDALLCPKTQSRSEFRVGSKFIKCVC